MNARLKLGSIPSRATPSRAPLRLVSTARPAPFDRARIVLADEVEHYPLTEGDPEVLIRARWATRR